MFKTVNPVHPNHGRGPQVLLPEIHREILSRVPYRSLCRFRCVSKAWLALCSDPAVRRRSPQTLSGFFCYSQLDDGDGQRREGLSFLNLSGWGRPLVDDPSLRFVRGYHNVRPMHCCGGILICYCLKAAMSNEADYVVCNPATEEIWAVLPVPPKKPMTFNTARLCFDPAVPRCFKVFVFVQRFDEIQRVEVYSSETGQWTSMRSEWSHDTLFIRDDSECVFFNDTLHLVADNSMIGLDQEGKVIRSMVTVDTEGKTWRSIRMPDDFHNGSIGQSQGRLYATRLENGDDCCLSVWVLEDYASGEWTLKCTASIPGLLGRPHRRRSELYTLVGIHPECSLIFLVGGARLENTLMSYDMDSGELHVICALGNRQPRRFQPYVPCFVEKPPVAQ